jgi:hypothetical protein
MAQGISINIVPKQIAVNLKKTPAFEFSINTKGADGRTIELRAGATDIEWKYLDDTTWYPLVSIASITGTDGNDGREIELQKGTTQIQWRYVGDLTWTDLIAIATLKGDPGVGIPNGGTTGQVLSKNSDANLDTKWIDQTGGGGGISEELAIAYAIAL